MLGMPRILALQAQDSTNCKKRKGILILVWIEGKEDNLGKEDG